MSMLARGAQLSARTCSSTRSAAAVVVSDAHRQSFARAPGRAHRRRTTTTLHSQHSHPSSKTQPRALPAQQHQQQQQRSQPSMGAAASSSSSSPRSRRGPQPPAAAAPATATTTPTLPFRVGHGFDLHRLAEGYKLIIGGVEIPHTKGCEAHSDGDVLLHTVTDALLGALTLPDIGQLFPDTDPKWKGRSSDTFLLEAVRLMRERGYVVGNLDATIIAQKPKLSPHKAAIRSNLSRLLGADEAAVNVKAKTHEKVDSIGEERSIACHAVVLLVKQ
jgi:2-C-methyl-D-erythritol 2,4-cyclodiphosphate synthase